MEQYNSQLRVCRTCLKKVSKREKMLSVYRISNLLMSYTSVKVVENDGLPPNVCISCHKQANLAYKFIRLCEDSDQKLRSDLDLLTSPSATALKEASDADSVKLENSNSNITVPENSPSVSFENSADSILKLLEDVPFVKNEHASETVADNNDFKIFCNIKSEIESIKINEDINHETNGEQKTVSASFFSSIKRNRYSCRFCEVTFKQQARLIKHEIKHERGITCYICEKSYSTLKQLRSHINIHNRKGAHLCQTCGKQFTMPENLVRHQRIHTGIRPYKCKHCNKSFTQSNELKSHLITHSSEKTHLCNVCGNKYARQMSLQVHMRRLHSDASTARPYSCEICGRTFKDKRDLSQHTSIHKGERKHVCKVCLKAFNRSSNLKVHERIHSGHRPFVCHICQRAFIQKHVLNTHLRTHPTIIVVN